MECITNERDESETSESAAYWDLFRLSLASGRNVLAYGPPGTGKTSAAMSHALRERLAIRHQCRPTDTAYDVLGQIGIRDGSTVFEPGAGALAVERGYRIVFDEIDRASEDVVSLLYSIGDGKPFALADGSVITPHARTQVVLTTNADPFEMFGPESGIRDRFPFVIVPEPSRDALATLPEIMRDPARRAVRAGITGLRAWQHFASMLEDHGYAADDIIRGIDENGYAAAANGNGLILASDDKRERVIRRVSGTVFGSDAPEIVRAFRIAACRDETRRTRANRPRALSHTDRLIRDAYELGRSEGLAEGLAENEHDHDSDDCEDCASLLAQHDHECDSCSDCESMYDAGREYASEYESGNHSHDLDCEACADMYQSGYESCECEHDHDSDYCGGCERLADETREESRERIMSEVERLATDLIGTDDATALAALLAEEIEA